jgi:ppGpp synthetase/RelA/SpoT-type nucleotidyltranferase
MAKLEHARKPLLETLNVLAAVLQDEIETTPDSERARQLCARIKDLLELMAKIERGTPL